MVNYSESLRGYGHNTHVKYNFKCQYCGYDGRSFPNWFQLTIDHIIPVSHGGDDDENNLITACQACNSITSRMKFTEDMTKRKIINLKKKRVRERQSEYFKFWQADVAPLFLKKWSDET